MDFSLKFPPEGELNTSIRCKFNIAVISQYVPEYKTEFIQLKEKRVNNETRIPSHQLRLPKH